MSDGSAPTAMEDFTSGCTVVWQHTGTRASLGLCGRKPAAHKLTVTCSFCRATGNQSVCEVCWPSVRVLNLCATCFAPTEVTEREE